MKAIGRRNAAATLEASLTCTYVNDTNNKNGRNRNSTKCTSVLWIVFSCYSDGYTQNSMAINEIAIYTCLHMKITTNDQYIRVK